MRSARVRGVLIGQTLDGASLDVSDIRWRVQPSTTAGEASRVEIDLRVVGRRGAAPSWVPAGSFEAGVLNQALRYAADQRVVATTITPGDGKAIGRLTALHPVLVDTPLGCRIVESDRWVDTFALRPATRGNGPMVQLTADRNAMYQWLRTMRLAEAVAHTAGGACPVKDIEKAVTTHRLGGMIVSRALREAMNAFEVRHRGNDPADNTALMRSTRRCAEGRSENLAACLCDARGAIAPTRYWLAVDHTSQVRERPAKLDSDLSWLRPSDDRLRHLEFWVHTTHVLQNTRRRAGGDATDEGEETAAMDFPAAQLASLRAEVARSLPLHLSMQGRFASYATFMAPLEEFVLSQRLARAALDGRLGRDFPLAKLVELEGATRSFVPHQPTIRWEPAMPESQFVSLLDSQDKEAGRAYVAFVDDQARRARSGLPSCDTASR